MIIERNEEGLKVSYACFNVDIFFNDFLNIDVSQLAHVSNAGDIISNSLMLLETIRGAARADYDKYLNIVKDYLDFQYTKAKRNGLDYRSLYQDSGSSKTFKLTKEDIVIIETKFKKSKIGDYYLTDLINARNNLHAFLLELDGIISGLNLRWQHLRTESVNIRTQINLL